jgi:hypothetical protein
LVEFTLDGWKDTDVRRVLNAGRYN